MTRYAIIYSHPIDSYISRYLDLTIEQFSERYDYHPEVITHWTSFGRKIESLPVSFIYDLSKAANSTMSEVYSKLLILQDDYDYFTSMYGLENSK
jgi:hypothetical protein